ncbi:MAG: sulfotransferase [Alphaproteobacteria bacterium]|nr:sulfotransferase [Alphaproteobacteria bacterium]
MTARGADLGFLVGVPRSGTTLLSFLLGRHPEVSSPAEPWLMLAVEIFGRIPARHPAESNLIGEGLAGFCGAADLDEALADFAADLYRRHLRAAGRRVMVDKTPRYWHILPTLRRMFPAARIVLALRDPFDVLASYKTTWNFDILSGRDAFMRLDMALGFRRMAACLDDPDMAVARYEDLVGEGDLLARVQDFLGLAPLVEAGKVDFAEAASAFAGSTLGDRKILATAGVHGGSVGRWRSILDPAEIQAALDLWGTELIERLGYGASLAQALEMGARAPDPAMVAAKAEAAEAMLARRWADTGRASRNVPGIEELRAAVDIAYDDPRIVLRGQDIILGLKAQLADTHAEAEREIARHRAMIDDARAQIDTHRAMLADAETQMATHRAMLVDAEAQMATHRAMVADAEAQMAEHRAMLEKADGDLSALGAEVRRVNEAHAALAAENETARRELALLRDHVRTIWGSRVVGRYLHLRGMRPPTMD